jgi:hypothetical protein
MSEELDGVLDKDPPEIKATEELRRRIAESSVRFPISGDVRLATGRFYTDEELKAKREKAQLPLSEYPSH